MRKNEHQFSETTRLHSSICRLYRIKEALLWVVLVGTVAWVMMYIVDTEQGKDLLSVMVLNLFILSLVIVLNRRYKKLVDTLHNLLDKE